MVSAATAASAAAVAAALRRTAAREELRRLRRFLRPLRQRLPQPPVPPPLPAGIVVDLRGRGEVFVRDTGPPAQATGTGQVPAVLLHFAQHAGSPACGADRGGAARLGRDRIRQRWTREP